jgi:hypothetical protein
MELDTKPDKIEKLKRNNRDLTERLTRANMTITERNQTSNDAQATADQYEIENSVLQECFRKSQARLKRE